MKMRPFRMIIALCAITAAGCAHWNSDVVQNEYGTYETSSDVGLLTSHNETVTTPISDFQRCKNQRAGMADLAEFCDKFVKSARPGQPPQYYWYGNAPLYYAGSYYGIQYAR